MTRIAAAAAAASAHSANELVPYVLAGCGYTVCYLVCNGPVAAAAAVAA